MSVLYYFYICRERWDEKTWTIFWNITKGGIIGHLSGSRFGDLADWGLSILTKLWTKSPNIGPEKCLMIPTRLKRKIPAYLKEKKLFLTNTILSAVCWVEWQTIPITNVLTVFCCAAQLFEIKLYYKWTTPAGQEIWICTTFGYLWLKSNNMVY